MEKIRKGSCRYLPEMLYLLQVLENEKVSANFKNKSDIADCCGGGDPSAFNLAGGESLVF